MKPLLKALIWGVAVLGFSAGAQADDRGLPFGLDQVHWTMSQKDFAAQVSTLTPPARAKEFQITNQIPAFFSPYRWRDCAFDVAAHFADDRLSNVVLHTVSATADCRREVREELQARYGTGAGGDLTVMKTGRKIGTHFKWSGPETTVIYNDSDSGDAAKAVPAEINFLQTGGPPLIIYDAAH